MYANDPWGHCARLLADAAAVEDGNGKEEDWSGDRPLTAGQLLACQGQVLSTGLGQTFDAELLGGGLRVGEVVEVFGAAGVGKTQLALTIAAHCAREGCRVIYATSKEPPHELASRLSSILAGQLGQHGEEVEAALCNVHVVSVFDFTDFSRLATSMDSLLDDDAAGALLVVDLISTLLVPFATSSVGPGHRWRLAWAWHRLRHLAYELDLHVLVLSHTVGSLSTSVYGRQLALGQVWAAVACTRLELRLSDPAGSCGALQRLVVTLHKGHRQCEGSAVSLVLDDAGVHPEPGPPATEMLHGVSNFGASLRGVVEVGL